ncbi:MAG: TetR/AcrR family transcriptional regulator [Leptospira sp.]|nr:TetR/AcrR family transcriptional regulator [Leptospira sp.]
MKKPKEKHPYHHGDLKKALVEATIQLLKEDGYQSLSLRKISKLAGVSQAAPYRHYNDLESLIADVASEGFKLLTDQLSKIRRKAKSNPLLQFRESGLSYVEFALTNPDLFQIMYGNQIQNHSEYETLIAAEDEPFEILKEIITDCKNAKIIKTADIEKTSIAAWTMVHGIAVLLLGNQVMFRNLDLKHARTVTKELIEHLFVGLKNQ